MRGDPVGCADQGEFPSMAQTLTLETTVVQNETRRAAEIVFVPAEALQLIGIRTSADVTETLGVRLGVPVSTVDEV